MKFNFANNHYRPQVFAKTPLYGRSKIYSQDRECKSYIEDLLRTFLIDFKNVIQSKANNENNFCVINLKKSFNLSNQNFKIPLGQNYYRR